MSRKSEIERFLNYEKNYNERIFRNALDAARIYDTEKAPREDRDLLSESQFQTKVEDLLSLLERKINIGADIIDNKTVSSKERNLFLENIPIIRTWNDLVNTYNNIASLSSRGVLESSIQTLGQPLEILMELYEQVINELRMIDRYDERYNIGLGFINEILYQIRNKFYKPFDKNLLIISGRSFIFEPEFIDDEEFFRRIEDISDSISTTSSSTRTRVSDIPAEGDIPGEGGVPAEGGVPEGQDIQAIDVIPISRGPVIGSRWDPTWGVLDERYKSVVEYILSKNPSLDISDERFNNIFIKRKDPSEPERASKKYDYKVTEEVLSNAILEYAKSNFNDIPRLFLDMQNAGVSRIVELDKNQKIVGILTNTKSIKPNDKDSLLKTWNWLQNYSQPSPASSSGFTGRIERVGESESESQGVAAKSKEEDTGSGRQYRKTKVVDNYMVRDLPKQFTFTPLRIFHDDVF